MLGLDLLGTAAFAVNGAMTAIRTARLDIVGIITLGMVTAIGGGFIRDILLGDLPPATFLDWRYLLVAASGGLLAFFLGRKLDRLALPITILDAVGLSLFAITGTIKGLEFGLGNTQAIILGIITAVGGGTIRDVLIRQIPSILHADLYAIPALLGAGITVIVAEAGLHPYPWAIIGASLCFILRMVGVKYDLQAPKPKH